jgi:hypothetical protein
MGTLWLAMAAITGNVGVSHANCANPDAPDRFVAFVAYTR